MKTCPKCGFENYDVSQKCVECGEKFDITQPLNAKNCPYCGKEVNVTAIYCNYCGREIIQTTSRVKQGPNDAEKYIKARICKKCGAYNPEKSWNCPNCGASSPLYKAHIIEDQDIPKKESSSIPRVKKRRSTCSSCLIIILVLFIIALIPANPSKTDHNIGICSHIIWQAMMGMVPQYKPPPDIRTELITKIVLHQLCSEYGWFSLPGVEYNNYIFFSTSIIQDKLISIGVFKFVTVVTPVSEWYMDVEEELFNLIEEITSILEKYFP